ncbi:CaiB/BaiF CoA transferase family protein [Sulfobacillus harzensis]|uniref:CoA transferase n=1 Tax=Sulfobacillus harzensis TaxID=2729629 RepID=A0A7Y0Q2M6_9FIRM|nr:CoA transferase [Sulfobacillus harzensis]NMP21319.1 CoA transferase [Sulfobacillus harzensis]
MQALDNIRVLDLTRILTGPFCTMMLADFGADVIKIEPPAGDDTRRWGPPFINGESAYYLSVNRNKRSIILDFRQERDRQRFLKMVEQADVVVENYRPGTLAKWGFDYPHLKAINPRIILASISGFGATGPGASRPGYDVVAQAMSGLMAVTGDGSGPVKAGFSVGDIGAGMWAAFGIMTALWARERTGEGQWIDTSLYEALISWQTYLAGNYFATGELPKPLGSAHPNIAPYQAVRAQDGYLVIACGNDALWAKMVQECEIPFGDEPQFRTNPDRVEHRPELIDRLENEVFQHRPVAEWLERLARAGVPAAPIQSFEQVFQDPQVIHRAMDVVVDHPTAGPIHQLGIPLKMSATPGAVRTPPPLLNQHEGEILRQFGLSGPVPEDDAATHP